MVYFFRSSEGQIIAVGSQTAFSAETIQTLKWLFSEAELLQEHTVPGTFIGPRREMITPWSTAAVEITQNMNISGISRIEEYFPVEECRYASDAEIPHDRMLQRIYHGLDEDIFTIDRQPEPIRHITDFEAYNKEEGLALSEDEKDDLSDHNTNQQLAIYWCAKEAIYKRMSQNRVDFAEQIEVEKFTLKGKGELEATFTHKDGHEEEFELGYVFFDRHVLVWVVG